MRLRISVWTILILATNGLGQNPAPVPAFEVASMKSAADPKALQRLTERPGGLDYRSASLGVLLSNAYRMPGYRIIIPDGLKSQSYDIVAKTPPKTSRDEQWAMLQGLLVERLKLQVHHEMRSVPVLTLTVGSKGARFQSAEEPKTPARPTVNRVAGGMKVGGIMTIWDLTTYIRPGLDRPIIDMTGLTGYFDIALEWSPDETSPRAGEAAVTTAVTPLPALTQALEQQLGLKLQAANQSMDVIVVDHVEKFPIDQ
jgi:uncharacterized protein (TIGR03435 family)